MASKQSTVDFLTDQMAGAGTITSKRMFGEFCIYCDGKVVGFVCDDQLYIKPTSVGRKFLDESYDAPPYPGAKMYHCVPEDKWDDQEWLTEFIRKTAAVLPFPKKKV